MFGYLAMWPLMTAKADELSAEQILAKWEGSVRPLLSTHCLSCHNTLKRSGKLDLDSLNGLIRGGLNGSVLDASIPLDSTLVKVLAAGGESHMPPEGQLKDEEIAVLKEFVEVLLKSDLPKKLAESVDVGKDNAKGTWTTESDRIKLPKNLNPSMTIDVLLEEQWISQKLAVAPIVDDRRFVRRIYLDLIGRIPRPEELARFLDSTDSRKRESLIDLLLASDEHAQHFAEVLDAMLIGRKEAGPIKRSQKIGWFDFLVRSVREDRPWNQVARDILLARPQSDSDAGSVWYLYSRKNKHQEIAEAVSKDFFGVRIDCAQCHDHPLSEEIKQSHYWGLTAFFNRSTNVDTPKGPRVQESAIGGFAEFANLRGASSPNELVFMGREAIAEARPAKDAKEEDREDLYTVPENGDPKVPKFSRRERFVEQILNDHPLVAKAMVNRLWGLMMGRGLVHPVDTIDSFHPASHPELLEWLATDFASHEYRIRRILKAIAMSRAYQLGTAADSQADPKYFSSSLSKPLTADGYLRSVLVALDVKDFGKWDSVENRVALAKLFPDVLAEESLATISQGLMLSNGELMQQLINQENSKTIETGEAITDSAQIVSFLFQRILLRQPLDDERLRCIEYLSTDEGKRKERIKGLAWALLTSAEFRFNY
jgi:mono/diheme cytochrome c family protein